MAAPSVAPPLFPVITPPLAPTARLPRKVQRKTVILDPSLSFQMAPPSAKLRFLTLPSARLLRKVLSVTVRAATALALTGPGQYSVDGLLRLTPVWTPAVALAALVVGVLGALANLAIRRPAPAAVTA